MKDMSLALSFLAKHCMFRDSKGHLFINDGTLGAYEAGPFPVNQACLSRDVRESRKIMKTLLIACFWLLGNYEELSEMDYPFREHALRCCEKLLAPS